MKRNIDDYYEDNYDFDYYTEDINYDLSNLFIRFCSFLIDILVFVILHIICILIYKEKFVPYILYNKTILLHIFILIFLNTFINNVIIPFILKGQTIGQKILKIKLIKLNGEDVTLYHLIIEYICNFLFILNIIPCFFTSNLQSLSQLISNTIVVKIKS